MSMQAGMGLAVYFYFYFKSVVAAV